MPGDITIIKIDNDNNIDVVVNNAYFQRKENVVSIFEKLFKLDKSKFTNKKIVIASGDYPEQSHYYTGYDYKFSTTIPSEGEHDFNLFPCPHSVSWECVNIFDAQSMMKEMLLDNRQPLHNKIFWAGGPQHGQRMEYIVFSDLNKDICDSFLTDNTKEQQQQYFLSLPDHANYKYLIDLQGQGYSGRLKYLLAAGRPVFIPKRPWVEYWHKFLIPWEHYVPVSDDFSDLRANISILENDINLYNNISSNARKFVHDHILFEQQLPYIISTLQ